MEGAMPIRDTGAAKHPLPDALDPGGSSIVVGWGTDSDKRED